MEELHLGCRNPAASTSFANLNWDSSVNHCLSFAGRGERPVRLVGVNVSNRFAQKFVSGLDAMSVVLPQQLHKFIASLLTFAAPNGDYSARHFFQSDDAGRHVPSVAADNESVGADDDWFEDAMQFD